MMNIQNHRARIKDSEIRALQENYSALVRVKDGLVDVCQHAVEELRRKVTSGGMETTIAEACGMDLLLVNIEQALAKAGVKV